MDISLSELLCLSLASSCPENNLIIATDQCNAAHDDELNADFVDRFLECFCENVFLLIKGIYAKEKTSRISHTWIAIKLIHDVAEQYVGNRHHHSTADCRDRTNSHQENVVVVGT